VVKPDVTAEHEAI